MVTCRTSRRPLSDHLAWYGPGRCSQRAQPAVAASARAFVRLSHTREEPAEDAQRDELEQVTFLDLNADIINYELERESKERRSGPTAEAILRRIGTVASGIA